MGNRQFPFVECSNKKTGRVEAADKALRILMGEGAYKADTSTIDQLVTVSISANIKSVQYVCLTYSLIGTIVGF